MWEEGVRIYGILGVHNNFPHAAPWGGVFSSIKEFPISSIKGFSKLKLWDLVAVTILFSCNYGIRLSIFLSRFIVTLSIYSDQCKSSKHRKYNSDKTLSSNLILHEHIHLLFIRKNSIICLFQPHCAKMNQVRLCFATLLNLAS